MAIKTDKPAEMSPAEIDNFQDKNKSREQVQIFQYPSKANPEKPATFYCAKPNRDQIAMMNEVREMGSGGRAKANDLMINMGVLAGDLDQLEDDDALYFGLLRDVTDLIEAKKKL